MKHIRENLELEPGGIQKEGHANKDWTIEPYKRWKEKRSYEYIIRCIEACAGNKTAAARHLAINPATLHKILGRSSRNNAKAKSE